MDSNCVFIHQEGINPFEASALHFYAQLMIKKKDRKLVITSEEHDTEIQFETNLMPTCFFAITGIQFTAQVNRGSRTVNATFLVRPTRELRLQLPSGWMMTSRQAFEKSSRQQLTAN